MMKLIFTILFLLTLVQAACAGEFIDDFSAAQLEGRRAERGEWKFENGEASAVADPELYKQFKNHGPILKWPVEFNDAAIEFEMKAMNCQRVVFTLNGEGHIFRVTLADENAEATAGPSKVPTRIIAWATQSSKDNKGDTIVPEGLPDLPKINDNWVKVRLHVKGNRGDLTIGDFNTKITHAALARDKNMVMLSFAHGALAVRNFRMTSTKNPTAVESADQAKPRNMKNKTKQSKAPPTVGERIQADDTKAPYAYYIRQRIQEGSSAKVPLIISLHGAGGGKSGVDGLALNDEPFFAASKYSYLFVKPATIKRWEPDKVNLLIDTVLEEHKDIVDPKRIYLYGYSMGGCGSWRYCIDHGDRIAAMMAIEGGFIRDSGPVSQFDFKHFRDLPVWAFHNRDDPVVPLAAGQEPIDAAKAAGGSPKFTIHESGKHKIQLKKNLTPEVIDWLFSQTR